MLTGIAFYVFSSVVIASALMVIAARNPVHSVLFLIVAFFNAAALFVLLGAEFLAMILIVVYVGAVAVLFLFVVMMLDIDFAPVRCFQKTVTLVPKNFDDPGAGDAGMYFDLAPPASNVILQLAPGRVKGIPDRSLQILVGLALDDELGPRHGQVDLNIVEKTLMLVAVGSLHDNPAAGDPVVVALQPGCLLADARLGVFGDRNIALRDLYGNLHGNPSLCGNGSLARRVPG